MKHGMQTLRWTHGVLVTLGILIGHTCLAQQSEQEIMLDPVIVTATRTKVPVSQTTRSVTVITDKDIEAQGAVTIAEVLRIVPGLDIVRAGSYGGETSVFTRGGEANYTLVMIDGVEVNLGGGAFDFADVTVDNIERIEVIRGPASTLYGSGAVSGVINIISKRGQERPSGNVSVEGGSFATHIERGSVAAGTTWGGLTVAASRIDTDGHLDVNNAYNDTNISLRGDLYPDHKTDITFTLRYTDGEFHFPTNGAGRVVFRDQFRTTRETTLGLRGERLVLPWWRSKLQLGFHRKKTRSRFESPNPPDDPILSLFVSEEERQVVDWQSDILLGDIGQMTFGIVYEDEEDKVNDEDRDTIAGYLQQQLTLIENVVVIAGFRVDGNSEFARQVTYQASAAYLFPTDTKLRAAVGTGFKEPTFLENFADSPFLRGNPDLDPERSVSWEVGIEQALWQDRLQLAFTFFHHRFKDLIEFVGIPAPGAPNFFNIQEATSYGIEISASVTPRPAWSFGVNYTYLKTEVTDAGFSTDPDAAFVEGEALLRRPTHKVHFYASYAHQRFRGRLDLNYVGARDDQVFPAPAFFVAERVKNPAYLKVDLALSYSVIKNWGLIRTLELFGRVENLLDDDYEEAFGFVAPGIAGFAGVKLAL
jgi:vitamin B12 transporter